MNRRAGSTSDRDARRRQAAGRRSTPRGWQGLSNCSILSVARKLSSKPTRSHDGRVIGFRPKWNWRTRRESNAATGAPARHSDASSHGSAQALASNNSPVIAGPTPPAPDNGHLVYRSTSARRRWLDNGKSTSGQTTLRATSCRHGCAPHPLDVSDSLHQQRDGNSPGSAWRTERTRAYGNPTLAYLRSNAPQQQICARR